MPLVPAAGRAKASNAPVQKSCILSRKPVGKRIGARTSDGVTNESTREMSTPSSPPIDEIVASNFDKDNVINAESVDCELKELEVASKPGGVEMQSFIIQSVDAAVNCEMRKAVRDLNVEQEERATFFDSSDVELPESTVLRAVSENACKELHDWKELGERQPLVKSDATATAKYRTVGCRWREVMVMVVGLLTVAIMLRTKLNVLDCGPPPT